MENDKEFTKTHSQIFFEAELDKARQAEIKAQKKFELLAVARLIAFGSVLALGWTWHKTDVNYWLAGAAAAFAAFLILMRYQQAARRQKDFQKNLQLVNEDEIERLFFRFTRSDTGIQFQEKDHAYSTDLDIFGEYSLYKLLNRTRTAEGSRRLANWLKNHAAVQEVIARQEASHEYCKHPDQIQSWEATAMLHKHAAQQVSEFRAWSSETLTDRLSSLLRLRWWPLVTLLIILLALAKVIAPWVIAISFAVHFFILKQFFATIQSVTNRTTSLGQTLVAYADLLKNAETAPFQSKWWLKRKALIEGSSQALNHAGNLFERLDYRNNPFFFLFVGIPTLWDVHCLSELEEWKKVNQSNLSNWLDVLADTEAMNSIAGHAFANPDYIMPQVVDQKPILIEAVSLGHPLIPGDKRVSNSFVLEGTGHTVLVTGSNMSGKSTFLRTLGLNIVLAQMGAAVSAIDFSCSPARVFSSMRTQDSLEESTSSFYAELKRLRKLLELADENADKPVFYLLDEILKGTNSTDRHRGAEALIRQLHEKNASGLVSTHDLELGEWGATENYVHNYHFRSDVEDGKLHFDYQLHKGICRSFNASELMRMMGIHVDFENKDSPANLK
jgi:ABC-type multidrug transport system fused ATPase/permease subunit